jgi:hypothetical protein
MVRSRRSSRCSRETPGTSLAVERRPPPAGVRSRPRLHPGTTQAYRPGPFGMSPQPNERMFGPREHRQDRRVDGEMRDCVPRGRKFENRLARDTGLPCDGT